MGEYHINGGNKISGEISVHGAKNSVLPILAGSILCKDFTVIHNCPNISDTKVAMTILKNLGCIVNFDGYTLTVDSTNIHNHTIDESITTEMRSSIVFLGSVLSVCKQCDIGYPGGCTLGTRPIDLHLKSLRKLGATIQEKNGMLSASCTNLIGNTISLDFPSVGATENIILASVLAKGTTIINNPAQEPELIDLQNFLNSMGAKIVGAGTNKIVIEGVDKMHGSTYTVMSDRIVAGTYLVCAAITKGEVLLKNVDIPSLDPILSKLSETNCTIRKYDNSKEIYLSSNGTINPIEKLITLPHPGFPTDMQSQFVSLLSIANGTSVVVETIFEARNKIVPELIKMGADIVMGNNGMTCVIKGVPNLNGATVYAKDLRGGAALILAGLVADGTTIVKNSEYVERGYEDIHLALKHLGADIKFV